MNRLPVNCSHSSTRRVHTEQGLSLLCDWCDTSWPITAGEPGQGSWDWRVLAACALLVSAGCFGWVLLFALIRLV